MSGLFHQLDIFFIFCIDLRRFFRTDLIKEFFLALWKTNNQNIVSFMIARYTTFCLWSTCCRTPPKFFLEIDMLSVLHLVVSFHLCFLCRTTIQQTLSPLTTIIINRFLQKTRPIRINNKIEPMRLKMFYFTSQQTSPGTALKHQSLQNLLL